MGTTYFIVFAINNLEIGSTPQEKRQSKCCHQFAKKLALDVYISHEENTIDDGKLNKSTSDVE